MPMFQDVGLRKDPMRSMQARYFSNTNINDEQPQQRKEQIKAHVVQYYFKEAVPIGVNLSQDLS